MIALPTPATLGELVAAHGGVLDEALDPEVAVVAIEASDRDEGATLAPILNDRGVATLASRAPIFLVDSRVGARVAPGRRWVHPRAAIVLAELLADGAPAVLRSGEAIDRGATIGARCTIEPGARIGADVVLGADVFIGANAVVYPRVRIGDRASIGAGSVVGREGFGFVDLPAREGVRASAPLRVRHLAGVVIEHDVEVGPLCTIDAGSLSATRIGAFSKLDAQIHVGHGVVVGARCRIAAQCGFAGSARIDDDVWIGGQVGVGDHVHIGRGARIAGKSGVIGDVEAGAIVAGYPAVARARWLRAFAKLYRKE